MMVHSFPFYKVIPAIHPVDWRLAAFFLERRRVSARTTSSARAEHMDAGKALPQRRERPKRGKRRISASRTTIVQSVRALRFTSPAAAAGRRECKSVPRLPAWGALDAFAKNEAVQLFGNEAERWRAVALAQL